MVKKTYALYGNENDWKVFLKRVKKRRKKEKVSKIVVGHTHILYEDDEVINTGTFIKGDVVIKDNFVIVSDAHLSTRTNKRKEKLLDVIKENTKKGKKVVLLGDIFELWTENPKKVLDANEEIIKEIINNPFVIFIRGNHDYDIEKYAPSLKGKVKDNLNTGKYFFYHGWEDDPVMKNWIMRAWYHLWVHIGDNLYLINRKLQNKVWDIVMVIKKIS